MASATGEADGSVQQVTYIKAGDLYATRTTRYPITFARLEKGLLLFLHVYEQSAAQLETEMNLWDHKVCYYQIRDGKCLSENTCTHGHETKFRQEHLCQLWYITKKRECDGSKCEDDHRFSEISLFHTHICTETDADAYKLIRFIRNAVAHFFDWMIVDTNHQQNLYMQMIFIMIYLVHFLSGTPKEEDSTTNLDVFLGKKTINQLIPREDLLAKLKNPCFIPEVFFKNYIDFNIDWYKSDGPTKCLDFNKLSNGFLEHFDYIFKKYYQRRLEPRGSESPWR